MSLEPNFTPPEKSVSEAETSKRSGLISWFSGLIGDAVTGFIVSGSMSYGANYSVKESSDIDMQLLVTTETVRKLVDLGVFDESELEHAINGYLTGLYGQFSLVFEKDGVNMECHFWDSQVFMDAITYEVNETLRLRSNVDTPSTDHGFSFARAESIKEYYGEMIAEYPVGVFPSYRIEGDVVYFCRPITNILGLPRIEKTNSELDSAIDITWDKTIARLMQYIEDGQLDLDKYNIENTLPGKNKMRQDILDAIRQKTRKELDARNVNYKG